jgi:hypothetical protein
MNAIIAYVKAFFDGELEVFATHVMLIGVVVVAEISLGVGIWLESPKEKKLREWLGLVLVLGGCVFSVIATVLLLIFDEAISRHQAADIEAARARTACIEEAAAWRLTRVDSKAFEAGLSKLKPTTVQLWFVKGDPEIAALTSNVLVMLLNARWRVIADQVSLVSLTTGIWVMSLPPVSPGGVENDESAGLKSVLDSARLPPRLGFSPITPNERQSVFSNWKAGDPEPSIRLVIGPKDPPLIDACMLHAK